VVDQFPLLCLRHKFSDSTQPGQDHFKAGMMTRILQRGWVRAGDLVEVLSPVEILRFAQDDTLNNAIG
jgi:MOSC domain-containing protein YiiM